LCSLWMNLNQLTPLSTWSIASGAESLLLRHINLLAAATSSSRLTNASSCAVEPRRFSGGLDLSKGGGSCSRQLKTFSGLMTALQWIPRDSRDCARFKGSRLKAPRP
jgi:hypothetical protein